MPVALLAVSGRLANKWVSRYLGNLMIRLATILVLALQFALAQGVFEKRVAPVNPAETQNFQKETKVALLVGVSKYPEGSGFAELHYAASDAQEMGQVLRAQGYSVNVLTDGQATRGVILRMLQQLSDAVDADQGTLLFYFSGHGFALNDKNYLAPISASESDLAREGLPVDEVEAVLSKSRAKRQLLLLDACRNDPAAGSKGAGSRSFAALNAAEGLRILNSTRLGRVSYESDELKHGVFTAFLLQGLRGSAAGSDGLVTFHDLSGFVTDAVRNWGVEHGRVQVPFEAVGRLKEASGDFLVAARKSSAEVAARPPNSTAKPSNPIAKPASSIRQSSDRLLGVWQANTVESGVPVRIIWQIRKDGTCRYYFDAAFAQRSSRTNWRYSDNIVSETRELGGQISSTINWLSEDLFELTIIDNGDPKSAGTVRRYQRMPSSFQLVGNWRTDTVELGKPLRITWSIRPDGTANYLFESQNHRANDRATWTYAGDLLSEVNEHGHRSSGKIAWLDSDSFEVTILTSVNSALLGTKRIYHRF